MMKAAYLTKYGPAATAFEIREIEKPAPGADQVLIKVEGFGLNFADVMARLGLYKGAPRLPAILGYEVVGRVEQCGTNIRHLKPGDRVVALTRFGGYAEYAVGEGPVVYPVPNELSVGVAAALATQYSTAYFLANDMANLQENDRVLIHAAAGGVGTALVQLAKHFGCTIYGTCSSQTKVDYLKGNGVDFPINYVENDFAGTVRQLSPENGLDVILTL
ncbi:MAG: zinc-binding dehydrogenase [Saprospiraceae bacterium]|nr:zinc-binding dehydrogenase [Saprospiraceae bacterium]